MFLGSDANLNNNYDYSASIQSKLQQSLAIIRSYDWLINCYVLDFYVDDHWSKLPASWREHLENVEPEHLTDLLLGEPKPFGARNWPLSLIALRTLIKELSIERTPHKVKTADNPLLKNTKLKNLLGKCVKPKKRHEIELMAAVCKASCEQYNVDFVIDFGAGQGHLARLLGYGYGIKVCCLEMQNELNFQASLIDQHLEKIAKKHLVLEKSQSFLPYPESYDACRPSHLTLRLTATMQPTEFLETLKSALDLRNDNFRFGIVGLHSCGDLGAIMMRTLLECKQARFLNFVGCCYMKLSTRCDNDAFNASSYGYPLSDYLRLQDFQSTALSYEAREIACHAIETYSDRLKTSNYGNLKVHSYRAAAERIIIKHWPHLKRAGLRSVKCLDGLKFEDYFYKAAASTPAAHLASDELKTEETLNDLRHWKRVVIFYTLRLMFAPLVESVILYDRLLFLLEHNCEVHINAIFDPLVSPRNHITSAMKLS